MELDPTAELPGAGRVTELLDAVNTAGITKVGHVH
jgi:hypothetical protein